MRSSLLLTAVMLTAALAPRAARAEKIQVEITEVPYRPTVAFMHLYAEGVGPATLKLQDNSKHSAPQLGVGLRMQSARTDRNIQLDIILGYRRVDTSSLPIDKATLGFFDIEMGGRFFPIKPTFGFGTTAFRLTGGGAAGLTVGSAFDLTLEINAGIAISWGPNPSGILIDFAYRPLMQKATYFPESDPLSDEESAQVGSGFTVRLGFLFGPAR